MLYSLERRHEVKKSNVLMLRMYFIHTNEEQDNQAISTDRLRALQRFHPRPIDVVVFHGLNGDTLF